MKKYFFVIGVILSLLTKANVTLAQTPHCPNATTQLEINHCAEIEFFSADREMNVIYRKVGNNLGRAEKAQLVSSQRNWLSFRDAFAKIYKLKYKGGSMALFAELRCKTISTRSRILELKHLLDQSNL